MRQTWEETAENHAAFLHYLEAEGGLSTRGEACRWRSRFWCALAVAIGLAVMLAMGGRL